MDDLTMKVMWCWRCKAEVPMLDEEEFAEFSEVYSACIRSVKAYRQEHGTPLSETPLWDLYVPARQVYERFTGVAECHHDHIKYHRISRYDDLCPNCGKPFRTSEASFCAACGTKAV
jgi:predicted amidophosphoribosyltransferase